MSTTVADSHSYSNRLLDQPAEVIPTLTGPAWYLHRQRIGALNRARDPFNVDAWLEAVNASDLHEKVKETAEDITGVVDWYGISRASRTELAGLAGVTRVATITARVDKLEAAEFISTKARFNQSNVMQLTVPYGTVLASHDTYHPEQIIGGALMHDAADLYDSTVRF